MRLLVATMLVAVPVASAAGPTQFGEARTALRADCPPPPGHHYVIEPDKPPKLQKLNELPPAEAFAAVLRQDERGCMVPVKYRDTRR